jgi:hypothetical protein
MMPHALEACPSPTSGIPHALTHPSRLIRLTQAIRHQSHHHGPHQPGHDEEDQGHWFHLDPNNRVIGSASFDGVADETGKKADHECDGQVHPPRSIDDVGKNPEDGDGADSDTYAAIVVAQWLTFWACS